MEEKQRTHAAVCNRSREDTGDLCHKASPKSCPGGTIAAEHTLRRIHHSNTREHIAISGYACGKPKVHLDQDLTAERCGLLLKSQRVLGLARSLLQMSKQKLVPSVSKLG